MSTNRNISTTCLTPAFCEASLVIVLPLAQRVDREVIEDDGVRGELRVPHEVRLELEVDGRRRRRLVLLDEGLVLARRPDGRHALVDLGLHVLGLFVRRVATPKTKYNYFQVSTSKT